MSGFLCAFNQSGAPLDREACRGQLSAIGDVGPDGSWLTFPQPWLALGECIRRDRPGQPRAATTRHRQGCTLVGDLRLDNRGDLLRELGRSDPDSDDGDLLLDAYLAWGPGCVDRLVGEFSFVVWNERTRQIFAARDPMGDRALYYAAAGDTLVFSNEIRVPRTWPGMMLAVNELAVASALVRRGLFMRDLDETLFAGVRQLPPGHRLFAGSGPVRTEAYWSIHDLAESPLPDAPLAQRHEEFRAIFEAAVTSRLRSAHPIGSHLSGGLDSTSVACVAAAELARSNERLLCFSHATRAPIEDISASRTVREEPFIDAALGEHANMTVRWAHGDGGELLDNIEAQFHFSGIVHPNHFQTWWDEIHAQGQQAGIGTMLTGTSGNLTASWTGAAPKPSLVRSLRKSAGRLGGPVLDRFRQRKLSALRPEVARRLGIDGNLRSVTARLDHDPRATSLGRGMNGLYRSATIARFGIELRDPMSDRRLVEFCLRAPDALYQRDGERRLLIREALHGLVPDTVLNRQSRQLQSADWVERTHAGVPALLRRIEMLAACDLAAQFIDFGLIRQRMEKVPSNRGDMQSLGSWNNDVLHPIAMGCFLAWVSSGCPAPALHSRQSHN